MQRVKAMLGPIPAHAGEPASAVTMGAQTRAYPRACGGARNPSGRDYFAGGLSPRMRGSPIAPSYFDRLYGPIPAHAGEPEFERGLKSVRRAYPRACGGAGSSCTRLVAKWGLSPRMRGSRSAPPMRMQWAGPIPAHAGEPRQESAVLIGSGAYPRACGGAFPPSPPLRL